MIGRSREKRRRVAMAVFASGPGDWMTVNEKMPMINSSRYWKS